MDHRYHVLTAGYGQGSPITKIVLDVDHQQDVTIHYFYTHTH